MTLGKYVPTISSTAIADAVIAQTMPQQPQQQAPQSYTADTVSVVAILLSTGAAMFAIVPKLLEKFGSNIVDRQKNRLSLEVREKELELEAEKAERIAAREEAKQKNDIIESTLKTSLANIYQGSRENREIYYLLRTEIENNNKIIEKALEKMLERMDRQEKQGEIIIKALQDIFAVNNMHRPPS